MGWGGCFEAFPPLCTSYFTNQYFLQCCCTIYYLRYNCIQDKTRQAKHERRKKGKKKRASPSTRETTDSTRIYGPFFQTAKRTITHSANRRSAHAPPAHEPLTNPLHAPRPAPRRPPVKSDETDAAAAGPGPGPTQLCLLRVSQCSDSSSLSLKPESQTQIRSDTLGYLLPPAALFRFMSSGRPPFRARYFGCVLPS